jgi:hypothetical protein
MLSPYTTYLGAVGRFLNSPKELRIHAKARNLQAQGLPALFLLGLAEIF